MKRDHIPISNHFPPIVRDALIQAAATRTSVKIDRAVDAAVALYPELLLPRSTCRPEFAPRDRDGDLVVPTFVVPTGPGQKREGMTHTCERTGCGQPAKGVVGFDFYPFKALMKHYRTNEPLTRMVLGLKVCGEHIRDVDPVTMLGANVWPLVKSVEGSTGIAVDMAATKAVLAPFDDPQYLTLVNQREEDDA